MAQQALTQALTRVPFLSIHTANNWKSTRRA
jgi:hypothetical protein